MKVLPLLNIQSGRVLPAGGGEGESAQALELVDQLLERGCNRIALTDVDAAQGRGHNRELVAQMMRRFRQSGAKCCIQVGGGIRSSDQAQFFLDHGATWLLLGTVLHRFPMVVDQLMARFRDQLTASIDARRGEVRTSGWVEPSSLKAEEMAQRLRSQGFRRLLFTDIPEAGGEGPDFATARRILEHGRLPVIMGGSLRTPAHVSLASEVAGLQGVCMDAQLLLESPDLLSASVQPCA